MAGRSRRICAKGRRTISIFRGRTRACGTKTGWGDTQLRQHLGQLEELEYLLAHRGGRGQSFVYELAVTLESNNGAIEGDGGKPVMAGLIDVEKLGGYKYDGNFAGPKQENAGSKRGQNGGVAGGSRGDESPVSIGSKGSFYEKEQKNTVGEETEEDAVVAALHRNNGSKKEGK